MRNMVFVFAMFLALSVSAQLFAAGLPPLDSDFPAQWTKALEKACTTKLGVELKMTFYTQKANDRMTKVILLEEKNGVLYSQSKVLMMDEQMLGINSDVLVNSKVYSFSSSRPGDGEKFDQAVLDATGLTAAEYATCLK